MASATVRKAAGIGLTDAAAVLISVAFGIWFVRE